MNHISDRDRRTIDDLNSKTAIDADEVSELIDIISGLDDKLDTADVTIDELNEEIASLKSQLSDKE